MRADRSVLLRLASPRLVEFWTAAGRSLPPPSAFLLCALSLSHHSPPVVTRLDLTRDVDQSVFSFPWLAPLPCPVLLYRRSWPSTPLDRPRSLRESPPSLTAATQPRAHTFVARRDALLPVDQVFLDRLDQLGRIEGFRDVFGRAG